MWNCVRRRLHLPTLLSLSSVRRRWSSHRELQLTLLPVLPASNLQCLVFSAGLLLWVDVSLKAVLAVVKHKVALPLHHAVHNTEPDSIQELNSPPLCVVVECVCRFNEICKWDWFSVYWIDVQKKGKVQSAVVTTFISENLIRNQPIGDDRIFVVMEVRMLYVE
jgi:hypothetical protein